MNSHLLDNSREKLSDHIRELFLGDINKSGASAIIVNLYVTERISIERLRSLDICFTFQGEEIYCCVKEVRKGIPIQLVLTAITSEEAVSRFLEDPLSVCLVPTIAFRERDGSVHVVKNDRYNPKCLN